MTLIERFQGSATDDRIAMPCAPGTDVRRTKTLEIERMNILWR